MLRPSFTIMPLLAAAFAAPWERARAQESLFAEDRTGVDSGPEGTSYELGTVFRASRPGKITHLRVYALAGESGVHTARLWRNHDNVVVGGPYSWTYGGANGWVTLDIPEIVLAAETDYTVVVSTGGAGRNYPIRTGDLSAPGGNGRHLSHPAGAGVFSTTAGARPTSVFSHSNYFRDVVFVEEPPEPPSDAPVRINEFMAANDSGLTDEDGEASDWIELYNPRGVPVELGGYQLTDGGAVWTFPALTLGAQSFLVVFASSKNRATSPPHTNFRLAKEGEYLALKDATGAVISEWAPAYPPQFEDISYGRGPEGKDGFMPEPTPGGWNAAAYEGLVAAVTPDPPRGFHTTPIQVTATTATPGVEIRYTVNGATPGPDSPLYTGPLPFSATATLRLRAFKEGFLPSPTATHTYVFPADLITQTAASAQAAGWPAGPINGQALRYGVDSPAASLYTTGEKIAALTQIPTLSLVTDQAHLTDAESGLYVNAPVEGLERSVSFELINPDGSAGFQVDGGLRIRGGQSRQPAFPKHAFNLFFRRAYGAGKLRFPLFGAEGADVFDTISLRCEHGYAYADPYPLAFRLDFTALRDRMCRELWGATGYATTRSRHYHLLLNGQYWGLYETQERAQEDYGETYFGGEESDYDGVAATGLPRTVIEATSGDLTAWTQLWSGARGVRANPTDANYFALLGRNAEGTPDPERPVLLDPRELAAYMLLHYYTGHADEPLSVSFNYERPNNFRALRRRGLTEPWHFFVHDGESSLRAAQWDENRASAVNLISPNRNDIDYSNPEWIHEDLLAHPEYRIAFADEAQRLLFNGGAFTSDFALNLWNALAARIDQAVIGESIRWAQSAQENRANWLAEVDDVRKNLFPSRTAQVLAQLRARGIFPSVNAPLFSSRGGEVEPGFQLTLSATGAGAIYYTTDGRDPRAIGGAPAGVAYAGAFALGASARVRARFRSTGGEWSALDEAFFTLPDDLLGYALAGEPRLTPSLVESAGQWHLRATYRIHEGRPDVTVTPQITGDLTDPSAWQALTPLSVVSQGDATALVTVQDPQPVTAPAARFIRLHITRP